MSYAAILAVFAPNLSLLTPNPLKTDPADELPLDPDLALCEVEGECDPALDLIQTAAEFVLEPDRALDFLAPIPSLDSTFVSVEKAESQLETVVDLGLAARMSPLELALAVSPRPEFNLTLAPKGSGSESELNLRLEVEWELVLDTVFVLGLVGL